MSISLHQYRDRPGDYRAVLRFLAQMNGRGHRLRGQVSARAIGVIHGLGASRHPFMMKPVWRSELAHLPSAEQARRMADPLMKRRFLESQTTEKNLNRTIGAPIDRWDVMYAFADPPVYEPSPADSIAAVSRRSGRSPEDLAYDLLIADEGRGLIYQPFLNYADGNLDAVREMLVDDNTIPGLSDGGAHVGTICDASFVTSLLQYWVRDRDHGRAGAAVRGPPAGAGDRARGRPARPGLLAPGFKADVNVIDLDALTLRRPQVHADLPAGGRRLLQRVDGILHTFVSGIETYAGGEHTGELPGRLVRGPRADPATAWPTPPPSPSASEPLVAPAQGLAQAVAGGDPPNSALARVAWNIASASAPSATAVRSPAISSQRFTMLLCRLSASIGLAAMRRHSAAVRSSSSSSGSTALTRPRRYASWPSTVSPVKKSSLVRAAPIRIGSRPIVGGMPIPRAAG